MLRRYVNGANGAVSMTAGTAGTFWYHGDGFGSVTDVTSATGAAQYQYAYEPFGGARTATKLVTTAPENRLQFHGQYLDAETTQYHLRARQYDPATGRFTATDPLTPALTDPYVASYAFAGNRPTVFGDPTGESFCLLGRRADGSCNLGGIEDDLADSVTGVVTGTVGFVGDTIDAAAHPVRTWKGMRDACQAGYDQYGDDFTAGLAKCIDNVNPMGGIRRNFTTGWELAKRGCTREAADQLTRCVWGTAATVAAVGDAIPFGEDIGAVGPGVGNLRFARAVGLSEDSLAVINRGMTVKDFVAQFRQAKILRELPAEFLDQSVEAALRSKDPRVRKLLTDGRFAK